MRVDPSSLDAFFILRHFVTPHFLTPLLPSPVPDRDNEPDPGNQGDAPDADNSIPYYDPLASAPPPPPIPELLTKPVHDPRTQAPSQSTMSQMGDMGRAWGMAFEFIVMIFAGAAGGWLLDRWLKSAPKGLMAGLALGFVFAFIRIVRATQAQEREEKARKQAEKTRRDRP